MLGAGIRTPGGEQSHPRRCRSAHARSTSGAAQDHKEPFSEELISLLHGGRHRAASGTRDGTAENHTGVVRRSSVYARASAPQCQPNRKSIIDHLPQPVGVYVSVPSERKRTIGGGCATPEARTLCVHTLRFD